MKKHHPNTERYIPISFEVLLLLRKAEVQTGFEKEIWEIAEAAIRDYVARHLPESFRTTPHSGYQWKQPFLHEGTALRTVYNRQNFHAMVERDNIQFNGKNVSPSEFANSVGGTRRNAWRTIWLLFPEQFSWKLAASFRPKSNVRPRQGRKNVSEPPLSLAPRE